MFDFPVSAHQAFSRDNGTWPPSLPEPQQPTVDGFFGSVQSNAQFWDSVEYNSSVLAQDSVILLTHIFVSAFDLFGNNTAGLGECSTQETFPIAANGSLDIFSSIPSSDLSAMPTMQISSAGTSPSPFAIATPDFLTNAARYIPYEANKSPQPS